MYGIYFTGAKPERATNGASGYDLRASIDSPITILPGGIAKVGTGLSLSMPPGLEAQVRPRSGLALHQGVTVLNAPGTVDSDYRGEVCVILINHSTRYYTVCDGDMVAQLVFASVEHPVMVEVKSLSNTTRGDAGFGSTGR